MSRAVGLLLALAGLVAIAGCASDPAVTLPADVLRLGNYRLATADEASEVIDGQQAIAAAAAFGHSRPGANAYLVVPLDPASTGPFAKIPGHTTAWIVRWTGINEIGPLPVGPDGKLPSVVPFQFIYVTVDAVSGQVIDATYME
ncbi:MAG: hypothetical protein ABIP53_00285 [Candidatus Limnocylindrales bacterium]